MDKKVQMKYMIMAVVGFFLLIPIVIVAISYIPGLKLVETAGGAPYFIKNIVNNLGFKLIASTFVSGLIVVLTAFLAGVVRVNK